MTDKLKILDFERDESKNPKGECTYMVSAGGYIQQFITDNALMIGGDDGEELILTNDTEELIINRKNLDFVRVVYGDKDDLTLNNKRHTNQTIN